MTSFRDLVDQVFAGLGSNPVLENLPKMTGPIFPGLVQWPTEGPGSVPFWRMIGVTADGRMWGISGRGESALLNCACCGDQIQLGLNFQHAGASGDCYRLSEFRLYDVRQAFLRWAVIRVQILRGFNPEEDSRLDFESLLVTLTGNSLGRFEDWKALLAWAKGEFWFPGERDAAFTGSRFAICEGIIQGLNDLLLTLPEVWQRGMFITRGPPSGDVASSLAEFQRWLGYMNNLGKSTKKCMK
jgi:hypothetical protein